MTSLSGAWRAAGSPTGTATRSSGHALRVACAPAPDLFEAEVARTARTGSPASSGTSPTSVAGAVDWPTSASNLIQGDAR